MVQSLGRNYSAGPEHFSYKRRPMPEKVVHIVSGDLWAGAETQIALQLEALRATGVDAEILLFNAGVALEKFTALGIPCHLCEESAQGFLSRSKHKLSEVKPDILVAHGYKESLVAFLYSVTSKTPWISTFHGYSEQHNGLARIKMSIYTRLQRLLARFHAKRIVTVSRNLGKELGFAKLGKLEVVRNVARAIQSTNETRKKELQHPAVLIVGRLVQVKRIDLALEAFAALNTTEGENAQLYIIGSGPLEESLQEQVRSLGAPAERIHFLGFRDDAQALIAESDILLLSSDSEGIPTVLLEAISANTQVVATSVGGIPEVAELIPEYPIHLCVSGSSSSLKESLEQALSQTAADAHRKKTEAPAEFLEHFTPEVAAQKHLAIYRGVLE